MWRWCFLPGPCCGNRHSQCLEVLLTSVQPIRWTQKTFDVGITSAIAALAAWMRPGQSSAHITFSAKTSLRPRVMCPSPR